MQQRHPARPSSTKNSSTLRPSPTPGTLSHRPKSSASPPTSLAASPNLPRSTCPPTFLWATTTRLCTPASPTRATRSYRPEPTLRTLADFGEWIRFEINRRSHSLNELSIPADVEHFLAQGDIGLVHADLHAGNILVNNGRIAAIVDWAEAAWLPRITEAYTLVTYLERSRCDCRAGLQALLATFNLDAETLEGFRILSKGAHGPPGQEAPQALSVKDIKRERELVACAYAAPFTSREGSSSLFTLPS